MVVSSLVDINDRACVVEAVVNSTNVDNASDGAAVVSLVVEGHEAHWGHSCVLLFLTSKTPLWK
jgi:hypothetical protein